MYCYCKNRFFNAIKDGQNPQVVLNQPMGEEGIAFCEDWLEKYLFSNMLVYVIPFIILFISWVSKTILRIVTVFEKRQSKPEEVYASAINMFFLGFVNAGIIILLVNFQIDK